MFSVKQISYSALILVSLFGFFSADACELQYKADSAVDYYQTPQETLSLCTYDCDDLAILGFFAPENLNKDAFIVLGMVNVRRFFFSEFVAHAWLEVDGQIIGENSRDAIFIEKIRFNRHIFILPDGTTGKASRIKLWNDMLERMKAELL